MALNTRFFLLGCLVAGCSLIFCAYYLREYWYFNPTISVKIETTIDQTSSNSSTKQENLEKTKEIKAIQTNLGFFHAFFAAISVIVVSELGDKTFFIAAIMAMRHSRLIVYTGAMGALGAMTVLSAILGNIVTKFIPHIYTYYISTVLFAGFGLKMLKDGYAMSPDEGTEEYKEVQEEVEQAEASVDLETAGRPESTGEQIETIRKILVCIRQCISPIFIQSFILTFLAEWGDRSQITTIVLAATENLPGVIIGGTFGHGLCTGLAVIGGRFIAQRISPKTVTLAGGVVFLCFALSAIFIRPAS